MPRRTLLFFALLALSSLATPILMAQGFNGYYRQPALRGSTIVFSSEGDLWKVSVSGGTALRLTTHPGEELWPVLSPDGSRVAFSATYEGPRELYVMDVSGGSPRRLTFEGAGGARPVGWTSEGHILYRTSRYSTLPAVQLVEIDPMTGDRSLLPLAQAAFATFDESGRTVFFARLPRQSSNARWYRGGSVEQIWSFEQDAEHAVGLTTDFDGTSKQPLFYQGRLYFISDMEEAMNLWSMMPDGTDRVQLTHHVDWDIQNMSLDAGRIVYQLGADLHFFNLDSGTDRVIPIRLTSDLDQLRIKWETNPAQYASSVHLSPTGDRVVLASRGELFVAPVKEGRFVHVSRDSGIRYWSARFSLEGDRLLALSDESGEVEWWSLPADGVGDRSQITDGGTILRYDGTLSPDSTWLAFADRAQVLRLTDLRNLETREVARSNAFGFRGQVAWSPDSRWIAYAISVENQLTQIRLQEVSTGDTFAATSDRYDSYDPTFSKDGKWLYFLSNRNFRSSVGSPWGSRQPDPYFNEQTELYALALTDDATFPFREKTELDAGEEKDSTSVSGRVKINAENIQSRLRKLSEAPGNYSSLGSNGTRLFWIESAPGNGRKLLALDLKHGAEPVEIADGVRSYEISADGKKLLISKGSNLFVVAATAGKSANLSEAGIDLNDWKFPIDPRKEWKQMFTDAWRLHRDWFYDENMHGVDWEAMLDKYMPLVDRVASRGELSDLEAQMVSELSTLHSNVAGGDFRTGPDNVSPAALGARFERDDVTRGFRITHIYRSDPDIPDERSPLDSPEVQLAVGDVITAVNGVPSADAIDIGGLLQDQAGEQVLLDVRHPDGETGRYVTTAISQGREAGLRYDEWEYTRGLMVDAMGENQIGYVHLSAMTSSNIAEWYREYYPVFNRRGLIVDVRSNRGGNIDSWILGKLLRQPWFYWQGRHGDPTWNMQNAFRGHMVVLVNENTASDGEAFAEGFRRLGLGDVIGTRTWGGEIWLSGDNRQVDGGVARASETGVYSPEGEWLIEGWGVEPDIVVDNEPAATFRGEDEQLKAAVEHLQRLIRDDPRDVPPHPPYPIKTGGSRNE